MGGSLIQLREAGGLSENLVMLFGSIPCCQTAVPGVLVQCLEIQKCDILINELTCRKLDELATVVTHLLKMSTGRPAGL